MSRKQMKYEEEDEYQSTSRGRRSKRKKKKSGIATFFKRVLIILLIVMVVGLGVVLGYAYKMYNKIDHTDIDKNDIEVNEGVESKGYVNLMLYGVDARNQKYESGLSDVIMIVSINQDTHKVKIASIYRDTYLQDTKTKTHAFLSGGPAKSMSIINTNLDLDITEYVAVNFDVVVDVVDAVGGVTIDITSEEAGYINQYINEINQVTGHKSSRITKAGTYTLDGVQATAYSRIRYTAGGDWTRTERQRKVLSLVFEKVKTMNLGQINNLADAVLSKMSTNVDIKQMLSLASQASKYEVEETIGWPYDVGDYWENKVWYGPPKNLELQVQRLHKFLFEDEKYEPSTTVKTISSALIKKTGLDLTKAEKDEYEKEIHPSTANENIIDGNIASSGNNTLVQ